MRFGYFASAVTCAAIGLGFALPARADLVIDGRSAQALHCAALLYIASEELYQAGYLPRGDYNSAQSASVYMLNYVPGTDEQKIQAMGQRFNKLLSRKSLPALLDEFDKTAPWCRKTFL